MVAKSIISFYSGNGHDGNLSVCVDASIYTIEFERIFGNRYFTRLLNPFSHYSIWDIKAFSEEERNNFLGYIVKILKRKNLHRQSYDVGLFDWDTPEEVVQSLAKYFDIKEVIYKGSDFTSHHKAHAAGAFHTSGFNDALVFSYDGGGNDGTFCVYDLEKPIPNLTQLNEKVVNPYPTKYARVGNFIKEIRKPELGDTLETRSHEHNGVSYPGKIMGLAGYGSFNQNFYDRCYDYFNDEDTQNISRSYLSNFGDFTFNQFEGVEAYDLAFCAQKAFEDTFLLDFQKFTRAFPNRTNICLTGGGALNVLLNEKLSKSFPDLNFFVPCSPGDSGISYGMIAHYQHSAMISEAMYSGCEILDKEVLSFILDYRPWKKATPKLIASELEKGKIIGVCRGDSETGPRALGNRTILADPRSHRSKDDINKKVKFREWFRPFAPICKEEKASIYFNTSENACYKYMSFSPNVRDDYQTTLPAVTHIDGSSRLQTISKTENEFIYNILDEFENITGVPVLINTSFNSRGKSILTHYQTAIQILDSTQLDSVILGDYYIYK